MARIGILTCSNATQDLGCSSVSCLGDLRKRKGTFASYPDDERIDLVGIINCAGCPTLIGPDKLLKRIRALTEFRINAIHFSNCVKAFCPFKKKYKKGIEDSFPHIKVVIGTHVEHITDVEFREKLRKVLNQEHKGMVDIILGKD